MLLQYNSNNSMLFCEKCHYSYNITKDVKNKQSGGKVNTALDEIFSKFSSGDVLKEADLKKLSFADIKDDERFDRLSKKNQQKLVSNIKNIDKTFTVEKNDDDAPKTNTTSAFLICKFCKNHKPIEPGTVIYSKSYGVGLTMDVPDYTYMIEDSSLPRTRAYVCKNTKCSTHKNPATKEAIIVKNEIDQVIYVCTVCKSDWINTV